MYTHVLESLPMPEVARRAGPYRCAAMLRGVPPSPAADARTVIRTAVAVIRAGVGVVRAWVAVMRVAVVGPPVRIQPQTVPAAGTLPSSK